MLTKELASHIRHIQIRAVRAVDEALGGEYHSVFRGQGIEFEEVREYVPGDEVRMIDWNVTARTGRPFIKRFREERELTILFLVDRSASGVFGGGGVGAQLKSEVAAEVTALLSFCAARNNDRAGMALFTDQVEHYVPPGKGTTHALRMVRDLLAAPMAGRGTSIAAALKFLGKVRRRRAVVFLISDFQDAAYERPLRAAAQFHDLIALSIVDPNEIRLPEVGLVRVADAETGRSRVIDTAHAATRRAFESAAAERRERLARALRRSSVDHIEIVRGDDYVGDLVNFFHRREHR